MKKDLICNLPSGMKDLLPDEAYLKRRIENAILSKFANWGYEEIVTPVIGYHKSFRAAEAPEEQFFKLIDRQGDVLGLRTDMTAPIARMVSSRMSQAEFPLRLCYVANVFRHENTQKGRKREFYQAGVELIGEKNSVADAEVISLAVESLQESGLQDFQISLGQVEIFRSIVKSLSLDENIEKKIIQLSSGKDFVELENLLHLCSVPEAKVQLILELLFLRGKEEVIDKVETLITEPEGKAALENLRKVYGLLVDYGTEKNVFIDFGLMRDFNYYTGIVFEGYTHGLGMPLCGGGRYDRLLGRYDKDQPATGFAIGVDRLMLALEKQSEKNLEQPQIDYLVVAADRKEGIKKVQELRQKGFSSVLGDQKQASQKYKNILEL